METADHAAAWSKLQRSEVDAWLTDDVLHAAYPATSSIRSEFNISRRFLSVEPFGVVIRLGDTRMKEMINAEIAS